MRHYCPKFIRHEWDLVFVMKQLIFAAAIAAAAISGTCIPSAAADLGPVDGSRVRHAHRWHEWTGRWSWRDRCAYAGYYCLYAWDGYVYHYPYPLDEERMRAASVLIVGGHDFTSFAAVDPESGREDEEALNVRTIYSSEWKRDGDELIYAVRGSGFLHHMVRNLVGTCLLVGKGTLDCAGMKRILQARDRSAAGPTAPACGLYLVRVEY